MSYWDTSALLKLYVLEQDSAYFRTLAAGSRAPLLSSTIVSEEMICALYRKEYAGDLQAKGAVNLFQAFQADVSAGRIVLVPKGTDILAEVQTLLERVYKQKPPLTIRSLDAIHLASALAVKAKTVITTDKRLREVSTLMNLALLPL